jgi:uncharacterized membrane protein YfhO
LIIAIKTIWKTEYHPLNSYGSDQYPVFVVLILQIIICTAILIDVREIQGDNQEWTFQRYRQHWHQINKHSTENYKDE